MPDEESEKNDMKDKDECIETIFQQWSQAEIRFCFPKIWQKERQVYEVQEVEQIRQFEDEMLWEHSTVEQMFEEEGLVSKMSFCFNTNSRKVKEKLQQRQVKEY